MLNATTTIHQKHVSQKIEDVPTSTILRTIGNHSGKLKKKRTGNGQQIFWNKTK